MPIDSIPYCRSQCYKPLVAQQRQLSTLQKKTARIDTLTARLSALEEQARTDRAERLAAATH